MGESSDVIALVESQHEQIEELLRRIPREMGSLRQQAFFELRRLVATHEAIEREILHPSLPADDAAGGSDTAALMATLESADIESTEFEVTFRRLHDALHTHVGTPDAPRAGVGRADLGYSDAERARRATARMRGEVTAMQVPFAEMQQRARVAVGAQPRARRGRVTGRGLGRHLRSLAGRVRHRAQRDRDR